MTLKVDFSAELSTSYIGKLKFYSQRDDYEGDIFCRFPFSRGHDYFQMTDRFDWLLLPGTSIVCENGPIKSFLDYKQFIHGRMKAPIMFFSTICASGVRSKYQTIHNPDPRTGPSIIIIILLEPSLSRYQSKCQSVLLIALGLCRNLFFQYNFFLISM